MNPTTQQPTYELLKDLPYLKAGTIYAKKSFWHFSGDNVTYYPDKTGMKHERFGIHADYIEDNPDWFRRVEVKDWEVVDCLEFNGKAIHPYHEGICLGKYKGVKPCTIHSVRRLSDGETFTIGETIFYDKGNPKIKHTWVIDNFFIRASDGVLLVRGKDNINVEQVDKFISKLPPSPPVEQETIKVLGLRTTWESPKQHWFNHILDTSGPIPESKHDPIKKAIEAILKNESWVDQFAKNMFDLFYSKEILQAQENAFNAARTKIGRSNTDSFTEVTIEDEYPTFLDYIQSLKK